MKGRIASRTDRPDATQIVIRPYSDADEAATLDVLTASLGAGPAGARTPEFFRWKHLDSPFGRSFILLALAGEQIVGVRALMRWRFKSGDSSVLAVRAVDTATHPDWQGQGLFTRLTLEAIDRLRLDTDFIFNTPNEKSLPGYLKMGWQIVEKVPVAIRVRRPLRFGRRMRSLNGPTPAGMSLPGTDAPSAAQALRTKGIEELLRDRAEEEGLSTPCDVTYLRWRYGSAPLLDYRAVVDEQGGAPTGLAIFRVRARGALRESTICELIVRRNDARSARRLLRAVSGAASVDHVTLHPRGSVEASAARRSGFLPSPGGVTFVVNPLRETGSIDPRLASSWALSLGDLEVF